MSDLTVITKVYKNIPTFLEYRRAESNNPFKELDTFTRDIQTKKYELIEANQPFNSLYQKLYIFVMYTGATITNDYVKKTAEAKKLLTMTTENSEVIFLSADGFSTSINKFIQSNPNASNIKNRFIRDCVFEHVSVIIPRGILCSPHRVIDPDEWDFICKEFYIDKKNLPKISVKDPQCLWIGANVDQVVEINRNSETTGLSKIYRLVVNI